MIVGNYASCTKSDFYETVDVITNFLGQPLFVKCDFWVGLASLWNDMDNEAWTVLIKLPSMQQFLCIHFLLCLLLSDIDVVHQKFTKDLHIY